MVGLTDSQSHVDLSTLHEVAAKYGLPSEDLEACPSPQGADNLNLIFRASGRRYVLRCYRVTRPDEVQFEVDVVRFLVRNGYPTPAILEAASGSLLIEVEGLPAALFEYVCGRPLPEDDPASGPKVATAMADLHRLTQEGDFPGHRTRTDLRRLEELEALCSRDPGIAADPLLAAFRAELRRLSARFRDVVHGTGDTPKVVVHHDMHADNIVVGESAQIVAVLDFDEAYVAPAAMDLASLLLTWALDEDRASINPQRSAALLGQYVEKRPLSDEELAALPDAVLLVVAADAAEYLTRGLARDRSLNPGNCNSLRRFFRLAEDSAWRDSLSRDF